MKEKAKKPENVGAGRRRLFKTLPLNEKSPAGCRQIALEYLIESDPDISSKWRALEKRFDSLAKLDPSTISRLDYDPATADSKAFADAETFFALLTDKLTLGSTLVSETSPAVPIMPVTRPHAKQTEFLSSKICEMMLKIFVSLYQHITFHLFFLNIVERGEGQTWKAEELERQFASAKMVGNFLVFLLDCHNLALVSKYADSLIIILDNLIYKVQKAVMNGGEIKDPKILAGSFYYQFEALAVLASCYDDHAAVASSASKMVAKRVLEAYNVFEKLLAPFYASEEMKPLAEICVAREERWVPHENYPGVLYATQNGREKIRMANFFAAASPTFTLGYALVWYFYKLAQSVLVCRNETKIHEQMMRTIYAIMKQNMMLLSESSKLGQPLLSAVLNTSLISLKFVNALLGAVESPADFAERLLGENLKNAMLAHLKAGLAMVVRDPGKSLPKDMCYYEFNHDAVSVIFKVLLGLRYVQPKGSDKLARQYPLSKLADEIVLSFIEMLEQSKGLVPAQLRFLKAYVVEYLASDFDRAHAEQNRSGLFGKILSYALPSVSAQSDDSVEEYSNDVLMASIIDGIRTDKHLAHATFIPVLKQIQSADASEAFLPAAFRLLYGILTGKPCGRCDIKQISLHDILSRQPDSYEPIAVQTFIDLKGMKIIMEKLQESYGNGEGECMKLMEKGTLMLHEVPVLCESLLMNTKTAAWILEVAAGSGKFEFATGLFRRCLAAVRSNRARAISGEQYLPIALIRFVTQNLGGTKTQKELSLLIYDVVIEFLAREPSFPSTLEIHQKAVYFSMGWQTLLDLVVLQGYA